MHKHAHLMMEFAKDALETDKPWERWMYRYVKFDVWVNCEAVPRWSLEYEYKRKTDDEMVGQDNN